MDFRTYIDHQFLASNWLGEIPMPPRGNFRTDKKALEQDCRNVGKSIQSGIKKVRKYLAK